MTANPAAETAADTAQAQAKRRHRIALNLTDAELAALVALAARVGKTPNETARERLMASLASTDPGRETAAMAAAMAAALAPIFAAHREAQTAELLSVARAIREKFIPQAITAAGGRPPKA